MKGYNLGNFICDHPAVFFTWHNDTGCDLSCDFAAVGRGSYLCMCIMNLLQPASLLFRILTRKIGMCLNR
jgi:hypothetical protein